MVYHVYCDESRQSRDRYMAYSGLIVHRDFIPTFDARMLEFRNDVRMSSEFKWTKVSSGKLEEYKQLVDYFFQMLEENRAHFKCLMVDNHAVDHRRFNNGDAELGFWKFYYQLLVHKFGAGYCDVNKDVVLHIRMDEKTSKYSLENLQQILNSGIENRYGINGNPFRTVEPRDSKKSDLLQINDVVLGALGYVRNGYHEKSGASDAKKELSTYILTKAGIRSLSQSTPRQRKKFDVWNFRLRK